MPHILRPDGAWPKHHLAGAFMPDKEAEAQALAGHMRGFTLEMTTAGPAWGTRAVIPGTNEEVWFSLGVICPRKPHPHQPAKPIFSCKHCYLWTQDHQHPNGLVLSPQGYYVCKRCWTHIAEAKVRAPEILLFSCHQCVATCVNWLLAKDPTLFLDLLSPGMEVEKKIKLTD